MATPRRNPMHSTREDESSRQEFHHAWDSFMPTPTNSKSSFADTLKFYCCPFDVRYEDLGKAASATFFKSIVRDLQAGLVGAMVALPLAISFAVASGLQPAQGIVGGAIATLLGALFGGSKYQVCGPAASFIPILSGILALNMEGGPFYVAGLSDQETFRRRQGMLVYISLVASGMLLVLALVRAGSVVSKVPRCIVLGFTIGTAVTLILMLSEEALGIEAQKGSAHHSSWSKMIHIYKHLGEVNYYSLAIALGTLIVAQSLMRISIVLPGALLAIVCSTVLVHTSWHDRHLACVYDKYGHVPYSLSFTPPHLNLGYVSAFYAFGIIFYYSFAIAFVSAVQNLLCARMADTLAENRGTRFHPSKELWGQGLSCAVVPLFNSFPHTGALDKTAISVKLGAVTPLAGILHCFLQLGMATFCARWLELIPMAAVAGLLWHVAVSMISLQPISKLRIEEGWPHILIMCFTAFVVVATDFLIGFASGMILYAIGFFAVRKYYSGQFTSPRPLNVFSPRWSSSSEESGTDEETAPILKDNVP